MSFVRTDPLALKQRLKTAGLAARKNLGQHFLIDTGVLDSIVTAAGILPGSTVVEIGPGPGALTERLLPLAERLVIFELDPGMAALLQVDFQEIEIQIGNILEIAPEVLKKVGEYQVVANLPYNITNPVLRLFLEAQTLPRPTSLVLMLQKEVAERLAAGPGKHGRGYLSVLTQYFADVEYVRTVPAACFWPAPNVVSAVVRLDCLDQRLLPADQEADFLRFVRRMFIQPRKQLKNVLAGILGIETAAAEEHLLRLSFSGMVRAQELSVADWVSLYLNKGAL